MSVTTLVFDAYGTLFDIAAPARRAAATRPDLAPIWPKLSEDWRRKQLEYTWLRSITGAYADFAQITAEALDWAMEAQHLTDPALRRDLLALYDALDAFPEVPETLRLMKSRGLHLAILSNGTPAMLASAQAAAGLTGLIDTTLSVESVRIYKPHASVYALVQSHTGARPQNVLFVSSNGWDIAGAARFGFRTAWVNRTGTPQDRLPDGPLHEIPDLAHLPRLIA
jgi:2-haloacid dehalogenase